MKKEVQHSLRDAALIAEPALATGCTARQYLDLLWQVAREGSAGQRYKDHVALNVFERWIAKRYKMDEAFAASEETLARLREDMAGGAIRREDGRKYGSLSRSLPAVITRIHNHAAAVPGGTVVRRLLPFIVFCRLLRFISLTPATRELLLFVERSGQKSPRRNGRTARPLTVATRMLAIKSSLALLGKLGKAGVEQVLRADVTAMLDTAAAGDSYRTVVRMLHNASPVFRIGKEQGVLADNVLDKVDSDTFKDRAQRDFLPPEEIDKILDLSKLDLSDAERVRDRLVLLLLWDLAVRRGELAGLTLEDVQDDDGRIDILLRPAVQKNDKPPKRLRVLFPATADLLRHYLRRIRPHIPGNALIVNMRGGAATDAVIYAAVQRESAKDRLDLHCYKTARRPTPHAFRRSFATNNSQPLGLGMSVHELADRLRDSVRVVDESYRLNNPLIEAMRADKYQAKLSPSRPSDSVLKAIDTLDRSGLPSRLIKGLRRWEAEKRTAAQPAAEPPESGSDWVTEEDALGMLLPRWNTLPRIRALRNHFRAVGALRRGGVKGKALYRRADVESLGSAYVPVADHVSPQELGSRTVRQILADVRNLALGNVTLIAVADLPGLSKALTTYRGGIRSGAKIDITGLPNST